MIMSESAGRKELTLTRVFDAPRDLVYHVWTDPAHVAQWWAPHGFTIPRCELDVRPGGAMRLDMAWPDGTVIPGKGIYHEVVPPERLVFTQTTLIDNDGIPALEVLNTVTFTDLAGKTEVTLHAVVIKAGPEAAFALAGMEQGWTESLERLATHLEGAANHG
jgi:uncharacterized protein YndB with AHSA1/START domain